MRKYAEKGSEVPIELNDASLKAIKDYVKSFLSRHNVDVDLNHATD